MTRPNVFRPKYQWSLVLAALALASCGSAPEDESESRTKALGTSVTVSQALLTPEILAGPKANVLFGAKAAPTAGPAAAYGGYAKGCAAGLVQLPETGPTWQAMRLSRNRNWGHPTTVSFIEDLSREAARLPGWAGLYVGDISQPRGGPMVSGHASHQMGLDADIWMLPPQSVTLSVAERESISSVSVIAANERTISPAWTPQHAAVLKAAASDPRVDRIFVNAPAKVELCKTATPADTPWMQKIRPYYGHTYHFHVRLHCPEGSPGCQTQTPSVESLSKGGNGCDDTLLWWVTARLDPPKPSATPAKPAKPGPKPRGSRDYVLQELPPQCVAVLNAP